MKKSLTSQMLDFMGLFQCDICYDVKEDMGSFHCGHMVCEDCYKLCRQKAVKKGQKKVFPCPMCKKNQDVTGSKKPFVRIFEVSQYTQKIIEVRHLLCEKDNHFFPANLKCLKCKEKGICIACFEENHLGHTVVRDEAFEQSDGLPTEKDLSPSTGGGEEEEEEDEEEKEEEEKEEERESSPPVEDSPVANEGIEEEHLAATRRMAEGNESNANMDLATSFHSAAEVKSHHEMHDKSTELLEYTHKAEAVKTDKEDVPLTESHPQSSRPPPPSLSSSQSNQQEITVLRQNSPQLSMVRHETGDEGDEWMEYFRQLKVLIANAEKTFGSPPPLNYLEKKFGDPFFLSNGGEARLLPWVAEQRELYRRRQLSLSRLYELLQLSDRGAWAWTHDESAIIDVASLENNIEEINGKRQLDYGCENIYDSGSAAKIQKMGSSEESAGIGRDGVSVSEIGLLSPGTIGSHVYILEEEHEHEEEVKYSALHRGCTDGISLVQEERGEEASVDVLSKHLAGYQKNNTDTPLAFGGSDAFFQFGSREWLDMWNQMLLHGRFHDNCCDVPDDEHGANISPSGDHRDSLSLGKWVAQLKQRFLRQELETKAAAAVTSLVCSGSLTFRHPPKPQVNTIDPKATVANEDHSSVTSPSGGQKYRGTGEGAKMSLPMTTSSTLLTSSPQPSSPHGGFVNSSVRMMNIDNSSFSLNQESFKVQPQWQQKNVLSVKISRGDGVLYRYKSNSNDKYYLGLGVVARAFGSRSSILVFPLIYYSGKDDKYKPRHQKTAYKQSAHSYYHAAASHQSFSCLQLKWKRKGDGMVEVATDAVISNQIKFAPKGYLIKPSIELAKRFVKGIGFEPP